MFNSLPTDAQRVINWEWPQYEPYFNELRLRKLTEANVEEWLANWTQLSDLLSECFALLYLDKTLHTTDTVIEKRFNTFMENVYTPALSADQKLKQKLLESGLEPEGFEIALRNMRAEADLFREENLPLIVEERKLVSEYDRIIATQTIEWDGQEYTMPQLAKISANPDRSAREEAWRRASARVLEDREALNEVWVKLMGLRRQIYQNADKPDYRAYAWQNRLRFDYTPENAQQFHAAIEEVVVPAAERVYKRRARLMGVETLRPWDVNVDVMRTTDLLVDPRSREPLHPFDDVQELEEKASVIFHRVDPTLGGYFDTMRTERLLDLANYKGKAPGAYCITLPARKRPFIFANSIGIQDNVNTLFHESGHAFHVFESVSLPYAQQRDYPTEFAEVASMAMELLAAPYLLADEGGFYDEEEAARARVEHLEGILIFWPYMAVVSAFQDWVYTHHDEASDPANCDAKWLELWRRFIKGVDWSGLDDEAATGWHRKLHIFRYPFYYIEYGLAQLGAVQVWANARRDQAGAVAAYRRALALGGTMPLPELYRTAGARFAFDAGTLGEAVSLIESTLEELYALE
ncbi:MAG: M3 family oligoendopeptidase [Chloroflexi bacterium]|nr:M3 family oligoendopeptidase [Chloroflexota bacterium]